MMNCSTYIYIKLRKRKWRRRFMFQAMEIGRRNVLRASNMIYYDIFVCKQTCTFQKFREKKISEWKQIFVHILKTPPGLENIFLGWAFAKSKDLEICFWPRYFRRNTITMLDKILVETSLKKYKKVPMYECNEN